MVKSATFDRLMAGSAPEWWNYTKKIMMSLWINVLLPAWLVVTVTEVACSGPGLWGETPFTAHTSNV